MRRLHETVRMRAKRRRAPRTTPCSQAQARRPLRKPTWAISPCSSWARCSGDNPKPYEEGEGDKQHAGRKIQRRVAGSASHECQETSKSGGQVAHSWSKRSTREEGESEGITEGGGAGVLVKTGMTEGLTRKEGRKERKAVCGGRGLTPQARSATRKCWSSAGSSLCYPSSQTPILHWLPRRLPPSRLLPLLPARRAPGDPLMFSFRACGGLKVAREERKTAQGLRLGLIEKCKIHRRHRARNSIGAALCQTHAA